MDLENGVFEGGEVGESSEPKGSTLYKSTFLAAGVSLSSSISRFSSHSTLTSTSATLFLKGLLKFLSASLQYSSPLNYYASTERHLSSFLKTFLLLLQYRSATSYSSTMTIIKSRGATKKLGPIR